MLIFNTIALTSSEAVAKMSVDKFVFVCTTSERNSLQKFVIAYLKCIYCNFNYKCKCINTYIEIYMI